MNVAIYKPNAKTTGNAFNFQISTKKDPTFYVNAIQQHSWNAKTKTGSFVQNREDPDKNISFKLNEFELGEILSAFEGRYAWDAFHSFNDNKTIIKLAPWDKKRTTKNKDGEQSFIVPAFGISVTRNGNQTFRLPLEPGEVEALKRLIYKYFDILFKNREFQSDDNTSDGHRPSPKKSAPTKTEKAPPPEEEDDDAPF